MRYLTRLAFALSLCPPVSAQQAPGPAGAGPARLFSHDSVLTVALAADFDQVFKDRDTTEATWHPAAVRWADAAGERTLPVELTTRGHFRLQRCRVPPLWIRFPDEGTEGTIWAGQGRVKLVTHCMKGQERLVLQEYLVYQAYQLLTPMSMHTRLLRLTWQEPGEDPDEQWAFLIEDVDDMAERMGGKEFEQQGVTFGLADSTTTATMSVFLYMVGGTDWSLPFLHNVKLVDRQLTYYPVPYDFDWTGMVDAPYARPDQRLDIRTVRDRLYRGPCLSKELLASTKALFMERKQALFDLYGGFEALEQKERDKSIRYLEEFYKTLEDDRRADRELRRTC